MTSGGSNFNYFPENQLTKVRIQFTVLTQIGTMRSFVQSKLVHYHFHIAEYGTDWPSSLFLGLVMQSSSQHCVNVAI